ncbi:PilW family protein [Candidatus Riflebacteria bacterium]
MKRIQQNNKLSFTLTEMMIGIGLLAILSMVLFKLFSRDVQLFGELGQRLAQQGDARISLELMYRDIAGTYSFIKLDSKNGELEFLSTGKESTPLSESMRGKTPAIGKTVVPNSLVLRVNKIRYYFKGKAYGHKKQKGRNVYREVIPGVMNLKSQKFVATGGKKRDRLAFSHLKQFEFEAFTLNRDGVFEIVDTTDKKKVAMTCMLVFQLKSTHFEQEGGALQMSLRFYSQPLVTACLYPGYFSTIDRDLNY